MNTSNNNLKTFLLEKLQELKELILKHVRIILPIVVAVIAIIILAIALVAHNKKEKALAEEAAAVAAAESSTDTVTAQIAIPEVALELNAYSDVNELIYKYYKALSDGNIDVLRSVNSFIDDTEAIRIEQTANFIDAYQNIDVYTKVGPTEGTYLAYVYSTVKFSDYETLVPGMQAYYICTDEDGKLYINDGEETETVTNYIREVSLQDDVVDLNNEIAVAYNDMLAEDEGLSLFLMDLTESIDTAVGEALAQAEGTIDVESAAEEEAAANAEEEAQAAEVVTTVKTTTTVNVRSSDSETADKLGKASEGQEFKLIETKGNGWSEIEFEGKHAFIKSEYLETANTETKVVIENDEDTATQDDSTSTTVTGTVTVKENVKVRASASVDSDKLGTVYIGQKLDLIQKQANGWTKVKYNGKVGYVKSDYVE